MNLEPSRGGKVEKRCAIYTRKSMEYATDPQFSSLEAQRAICYSYISSQLPNGWSEMPKHYDDCGHSGGTLMRPALQELLADVEAGVIDAIVVYKLARRRHFLATKYGSAI